MVEIFMKKFIFAIFYFLKPTLGKILLSILFLVLIFVVSIVLGFFGLTVTNLGFPCFSGSTSLDNPQSLYQAWEFSRQHCAGYSNSMLVKFFMYLDYVFKYILWCYLPACVVTALYRKINRKKN